MSALIALQGSETKSRVLLEGTGKNGVAPTGVVDLPGGRISFLFQLFDLRGKPLLVERRIFALRKVRMQAVCVFCGTCYLRQCEEKKN